MSKKHSKEAKSEPVLDFNAKLKYAAAPESASIAKMTKQYELYINGAWVKPAKGQYFETYSPSTEQLLAKAGMIGAAGSVERGTTVSDYDPQEKSTLHSLRASVRAAWASGATAASTTTCTMP